MGKREATKKAGIFCGKKEKRKPAAFIKKAMVKIETIVFFESFQPTFILIKNMPLNVIFNNSQKHPPAPEGVIISPL
jgi:hypothetical protein